jgi:hypothetical protein
MSAIASGILNRDMTPQFAGPQALDDIYDLLCAAAARKQPVAAIYDGFPRLLCPHVLGRNREGRLRAFCYQFGGSSGSGLRVGPEGIGGWRCIAVEKLSQVEIRVGAWRTESRSSPQHCVQEIDFDADAQCGDSPQKGQ